MNYELRFGCTVMPDPKSNGGLTETCEDIWSANTGRNESGTMVGTLVATKTKLRISWNALSWEQAALIRSAVCGKGFTTCTYPGIDGSAHTITGYFGTPTFSHYSWADGLRSATAITVDFIEQ